MSIEILQTHLENKYPEHDFKWQGGEGRKIGLCPEHDDHSPSFNIFKHDDKSYFKCFSCGFKGSLYDFIKDELTPEEKEKYENNKKIQKTLSETLKELKNYLFTADTVESVFARKYLTETRFLDLNAIKPTDIAIVKTQENYDEINELLEPLASGKPNKLEYYSGLLVFCHTDIEGNICLLRFRSPDDNKDIKTAKIKGFNKHTSCFNLSLIGKSANKDYPLTPFIFITEGEFNSLTYISQTGSYNILSAGPKDNVKKELINQILEIDYSPIITLDQDEAGLNRLKKLYSETNKNKLKKIIYCEYGERGDKHKKDFDDIFKNKSEEGINEVLLGIKYKTFDRFQEFINEENLNKEIKIEEFINDNILGDGLKEIYLNKYKISTKSQVKIYNIENVLADKTEDKFNGIFPVGVNTLAGYPGSGKTYSAIYIALFYAIDNPGEKVFLWLSEDSKAQVKKRINYLLTKNKIEMPKNIFFCFDIALPIFEKQFGGYVKSKFYMNVRETILGYSLIFLDPLVDFSAGIDENGNGGIAQFLLAFKEISKEKDASIVFLHHVNKEKINTVANPESEWITTGEKNDRLFKVRGASAVAGSSRLVLYCESNPKKENERIISVIKFNSGPEGKILYRVELPAKPINHSYEKHENKKRF